MSSLPLGLLLAAALDPRVSTVLEAIAEPGCPRLYSMLTAEFRREFPRESWGAWCASVGKLQQVESLGTRDGWSKYRATSNGRKILFDVAFDRAGKVAGLLAKPDETLPEREAKLSLPEELARLQKETGVPALAALVLRDGREEALVATGVRKLGDPTAVTIDDRWHLGSDTKAMTATLAGILVEEQRLRWTSTVAEVLSDWKDLHPDFGKVTLELLLANRGGLPAHVSPPEWRRMWDARDQIKQRRETVHALLRAAPPHKVGEFLYSNFGYLVAGVMLEKVSGMSWEAAMRKRLFEPLKMSSCGFGAPASRGKIDHPWAHQTKGESLVPLPPGPRSDNPPSLGPAGTVHCSLRDWAKFIQLHLDGAHGKNGLVTAATIRKLQTPIGDYALGWGTTSRKFGRVLAHDGSNTLFFARAWLLPAKNTAFLMVTNAAGPRATGALDRLFPYLRARYVE